MCKLRWIPAKLPDGLLQPAADRTVKPRIGLYGGSFDPIHVGHLISARALAEQIGLSRVILIPAGVPPHKRGHPLTPADHRLAMARLAVQDDPLFEVDDCELLRTGPSYTIETIEAYRARLGGDAALYWIIGCDSLAELPTWHRVADLVERVQIVTMVRPGSSPPPAEVLATSVGDKAAKLLLESCYQTPAIEISATDIRSRVGTGRSIRYLVPEAVRRYIEQNRIYDRK